MRKGIEYGVACVAILAKEEAPGLPITGASAAFLASHRAKEEPQHDLAYFDERVGQGFGRRYTQMFLSRWPASLPPRFQLGTNLGLTAKPPAPLPAVKTSGFASSP